MKRGTMESVNEKISQWRDRRTRIPKGKYYLECVKAARGTKEFHGAYVSKVTLWFGVTGDGKEHEGIYEHLGKIIPAYLPIGENDKVLPRSYYHKFWVIANEFQEPERLRLKEMPPSLFVGKIFYGFVTDAIPKWPTGEEEPEYFHYSKVKILYELIL